MAEKKDYYTTSQTYTDLDGQYRSFTMVDHDPKTRVSYGRNDLRELNQKLMTYRDELIERITSCSATLCPVEESETLTLRGDRERVEWNVKALSDQGYPTDRLIQLVSILEKRSNK